MPNYFMAPVQLYLISYPPGPWPPYQQYYAGQHGHIEEDSEMAKPNKFTGWDPSELHPFIISVTSCNTPVTLLTNFQLVLGHTVTSIRIPRFPELMFHA